MSYLGRIATLLQRLFWGEFKPLTLFRIVVKCSFTMIDNGPTPSEMQHDRKAIRIASRDDSEAIERISKAAYTKWISRIGREPLPMQVDYSMAISKHRFDVLEINGIIVGLIETVPKDGYLLIQNVAVSPDYQRKGVGRLLLAHAEHVAKASGFEELRLYTNELFEGNVSLYQNIGYSVIERSPIKGGVKVDMMKLI